MASIYGLFDPRLSLDLPSCRYVGQTGKPIDVRLDEHVSLARTGKKRHVLVWIRKLIREGVEPVVILIEQIDDSDPDAIDEAEIRWIAKGRAEGWRLTNQNNGGRGNRGYVPTEEDIRKSVEARRGFKHSDETRVRMSAASLGKPKSPEHRANLSAALMGKPQTPAQAEAAAKRRGVPLSEEVKAKQSESLRNSDKLKKAGERRRGVPLSEETRAAISTANTDNPGIIAASKRGNERYLELMQDPEYAAEWNRRNQVALAASQHSMRTKRMQCDECGFISNPQGIGHHQTSFGHIGKTMLEPIAPE